MESVVLVVHLMIALAIIAVVLLQRSEGGGLGIGGGGNGGMGGLASPRATADFLTRLTGILAASFMATSLILAILSGANRAEPVGILELAGDAKKEVEVAVPLSEGDVKEAVTAVEGAVDKAVKEVDPAAPSPTADTSPKAPVSE